MDALALPLAAPVRWLRRLLNAGRGRLGRRAPPLSAQALQMLNAVLADAGVIVIVIVHDADGRCIVCNAEAARVVGLAEVPPPGSSLGRVPEAILRGSAAPAGDETWHTPAGARLYRVDRGRLPSHMPGASGPCYLVARDVTEQRQHAERLMRKEQQLSLAMRGPALGL